MASICVTTASLATSPLFRDLPAETIADLEAVTSYRRYAAGEVVIAAAPNRSHDFYVVLDGSIEVVRGIGEARSVSLAEVGPGDWFGEFAVIDGKAGSASVRARTPALLAVVPREKMADLMATHPPTAFRVMERMVRVIRLLDDWVVRHHAVDARIDEIHRELVRLTI